MLAQVSSLATELVGETRKGLTIHVKTEWVKRKGTNCGGFSDMFPDVSKCASRVATETLIACKFLSSFGQATCNYALARKDLIASPNHGTHYNYYVCYFYYTAIYLKDICVWLLDSKRPSNRKIVSALVWYICTMYNQYKQSDHIVCHDWKKKKKSANTELMMMQRLLVRSDCKPCAACRLERASVQHWLLSSPVTIDECGRDLLK